MEKEYSITGMTCAGCVAKVQRTLSNVEGIESVRVQLEYPQAIIKSSVSVDLASINQVLSEKGKYQIFEGRQEEKIIP